MTNISIIARLQAHRDEARLFPHVLQTKATPEGPLRYVWLTVAARDYCFPAGRHPDKDVTAKALAHALYQLDSFILGRYMERGEDLKLLDPVSSHTWEIRTHIVPKIRLFGWFLMPRHFVVAHCKLRDWLGNYDSPRWKSSIQKVVEVRRSLFPEFAPYASDRFGDYVG